MSIFLSAQERAEPNFIKALRAKHGLKSREETRKTELDAKRAPADRGMPSGLGHDDDDGFDVNEEDQPTVVVLKSSHLTQEEAEAAIAAGAYGAEGVLRAANKTKDAAQDEASGVAESAARGLTDKAASASGSAGTAGKGKVGFSSSSSKQQQQPAAKKPRPAPDLPKSLNKKNAGLLSFDEDQA